MGKARYDFDFLISLKPSTPAGRVGRFSKQEKKRHNYIGANLRLIHKKLSQLLNRDVCPVVTPTNISDEPLVDPIVTQVEIVAVDDANVFKFAENGYDVRLFVTQHKRMTAPAMFESHEKCDVQLPPVSPVFSNTHGWAEADVPMDFDISPTSISFKEEYTDTRRLPVMTDFHCLKSVKRHFLIGPMHSSMIQSFPEVVANWHKEVEANVPHCNEYQSMYGCQAGHDCDHYHARPQCPLCSTMMDGVWAAGIEYVDSNRIKMAIWRHVVSNCPFMIDSPTLLLSHTPTLPLSHSPTLPSSHPPTVGEWESVRVGE